MSTLNLASELFTWRLSIKFYHWNTTVYSRHIATCGFLSTLDTAIDSIIEKYIARYGRPIFDGAIQIPVVSINDMDAINIMKKFVVFLQKEFPKYVKNTDTDLLNLRDDLLGNLQNTIYLFSLE